MVQKPYLGEDESDYECKDESKFSGYNAMISMCSMITKSMSSAKHGVARVGQPGHGARTLITMNHRNSQLVTNLGKTPSTSE